VDGVDVSRRALAAARRRLDAAGVANATLFHTDGLALDALSDRSYDVVYSTQTLSHIPVHAVRYRFLEEFFRILECDGHAALEMGFGPHAAGVRFHADAPPAADARVAFENPRLMADDLDRVGFRDVSAPRRRSHPKGLRDRARRRSTSASPRPSRARATAGPCSTPRGSSARPSTCASSSGGRRCPRPGARGARRPTPDGTLGPEDGGLADDEEYPWWA